ncbi:MAG: hypothetical protein V4542_14885 [Pseudomonadota bacterium]
MPNQKPAKYNASLQAANGIPDNLKAQAETRFLEVLEKAFGSPSKVRGAYVEWLAARSLHAENPFDSRTQEELQAISLWESAAEAATRAVFSQLKINVREAFFELHVWNSRTN